MVDTTSEFVAPPLIVSSPKHSPDEECSYVANKLTDGNAKISSFKVQIGWGHP